VSLEENTAVTPPLSANNYPLIVLAGFGAMLAGAALWTLVTVITNTALGLMAIAVGLIVGFTIQKVRTQRDRKLAWLGAGLALAGCVLGNALSLCFFLSKEYGISADQVFLRLGVDGLARMMVAAFDPMDLLFYGIALYEGFKFSNR
jgi:hypothetical protein